MATRNLPMGHLPQRTGRGLVAVAAMAFLAMLPAMTVRADEWHIVKVEDRDYLTIDNIAQFYALQAQPRQAANHLVLEDNRVRLELCGNPREIYVNGVKQWLSFPILNRDGQTLVSRFDLAKTIEPSLRPTMISNLQPFRTVVLDAGHGGQDGGGRSMTGAEKEYTLDVIRDLKRALESKNLKVILTRESDAYLPLEDRASRANETVDSVFVSLHFNSSGDASAAGFEVYAMTPRGAASTGDGNSTSDQFVQMPGNDFDDASLALATCVQHSLLGYLPQVDRGVRRARFAVLRLTHSPAILIEGGFLTNPSESQHINDAVWRQKLAEAIAAGVGSYGDVAGRKQPPKLVADYRSERLPLTGVIVDPAKLAVNPPLKPADVFPVSNPLLSQVAPLGSTGLVSSTKSR